MKVTVHIERRPEIADPEGSTIARSLADLGYNEVQSVRTGRTLHLDVSGDDEARVRDRVEEMCEKLLANPVIEDFRVEIG
ncbi:MAG TPA: phosphoribosylformylglycinamidine synthase subunit PurS [Acidimicrobiia bacterium]|jgi:phosphoribosylformylglycinamidine synthase|nr:phosphoribosylformylglycinamidine synthase subunit PurS [Acidimicrobiia bacterium]